MSKNQYRISKQAIDGIDFVSKPTIYKLE